MDASVNMNSDIRDLIGSLTSIENDFAQNSTVLLTGKQIVKNLPPSGLDTWVNVYPEGIPTNQCHRTLLVAIGQNDNVEKSVLAAIEHTAVKCRGKTNNVVFWAVSWSSLTWPAHKNSFKGITVVLKPFYADPTLLSV